jgi:hypothetical protein
MGLLMDTKLLQRFDDQYPLGWKDCMVMLAAGMSMPSVIAKVGRAIGTAPSMMMGIQ